MTDLTRNLSQGRIVTLVAIALLVVFAATLPGFATADNILSLLQSVSIIGILGLGLSITIIGRGIDLSIIAVAVMPVAWAFVMIGDGTPVSVAVGLAIATAALVGLLNGWLIAYVEVPAIFTTLATGIVTFGLIQYFAVSNDLIPIPEAMTGLAALVRGTTFGVPNAVLAFLAVAAVVALFLRLLVQGRFVYAIGDNPMAARITGIAVRPSILLQYVLSALIALLAGFFLATTVDGANTRIFQSTMVYDVILVVVLGGVGLAGGKGGVANVLVGTAVIGILGNGLTIMNVDFYTQNLVKASILLVAIVIDSLLNPRDEQTAQQGDI